METAVAFQDVLKFPFSFSEQIHEITFTHSAVKHGSKETNGIIYLKEH